MAEKTEHTQMGIASIILGVLGLICYIIGWVFFSFVDNRLYGMIIGLILAIFAIILGYIARKQGDSYGTYGVILGGFTIILTLVIIVLATPTSVEIG